MKFVLLSSSNTLNDGAVVSSKDIVESESMEQISKDLALKNFWHFGDTTAFRVNQIIPYDSIKVHIAPYL